MRDVIPWAKPAYWGNEEQYLLEALHSTWISGGPFVDRLESEFASFSGLPYALAVANGTAAVHLTLLALGIGHGDEVIVPGFAFMAVANLSVHVGATPVFADVDPVTWCLTAEEIERRMTPRTKAIAPIHTYGNVCDMPGICELGQGRRVAVVEDVAEALASRYDGKLAGTFGDLGTFSFHATKTITTGEGGMVVTKDSDLYDRMALYRSHGMRRSRAWYLHEVAGHNFRLTNLQAALGCAQLEKLSIIMSERRRVYETYKRSLAGFEGVTLQGFERKVEPVVWACALRLDPEAFPQGRDELMRQMLEAGVETRPGFFAATAMSHIYQASEIPVSEQLSRWVLSLPFYATLTEEQIQYACSVLSGFRR